MTDAAILELIDRLLDAVDLLFAVLDSRSSTAWPVGVM